MGTTEVATVMVRQIVLSLLNGAPAELDLIEDAAAQRDAGAMAAQSHRVRAAASHAGTRPVSREHLAGRDTT